MQKAGVFPLLCHCYFFLLDCRAHEAYGNNSMGVWVERRRDKNKRRQEIRPSSKGGGRKDEG